MERERFVDTSKRKKLSDNLSPLEFQLTKGSLTNDVEIVSGKYSVIINPSEKGYVPCSQSIKQLTKVVCTGKKISQADLVETLFTEARKLSIGW